MFFFLEIVTPPPSAPSGVCTANHINRKGINKQKECIFPFKYKGKTYNKCTRDSNNSSNQRFVPSIGNIDAILFISIDFKILLCLF